MVSQPELRDALFIPSDSRENFKQIIAKRSDLAQFDGGRIKPAGSGTVTYEAGLVLGLAATGGDAGYYKPYVSSNTDGSQVAVGVLAEQAVVDTSDNGGEIAILKEAILYKDLLIGYDSTAKSNMNATESVEHGVNLVRIRA